MLTITKKNDTINFNKIQGRTEYKNAYLEKCNCIIETESFHRYNKFMIYRFKIVTKTKDIPLYGYVDSFLFKDFLYSFIYLTDSIFKFEKYLNDYQVMLKLLDKSIE